LAVVNASIVTVLWLFATHHVSSLSELYLVLMFIGALLLMTVLFWMLYIALEPYVRRQWPQILVSWTRLLSGQWKDPLVARDVLIGCACGALVSCMVWPIRLWFPGPAALP